MSLRADGVDVRLALAGIVLLAIAVRLAALGSRFHVDDAYSWWVASAPRPHVFLSRFAASENTPPLFYLLLTPLPVDQPVWLRLPAAVPGVLMCVVLYIIDDSRVYGGTPRPHAGTRTGIGPYVLTLKR